MKNRFAAFRLPGWLLVITLSSIALLAGTSVFSAEDTDEQVTEEAPATVQVPVFVEETAVDESTESEEPKPGKEDVESPDVFNPSEEISEDFAVAFPVDI